MDDILITETLHKQYQMGEITVDALRGVDLIVHRGEFVAIMGPSGSGKSTLLHLIGGLDDITDGEILLGGRKLAHLHDDEVTIIRRRHVGVVFQFYNLIPNLTAAENVALPMLLDGKRPEEFKGKVDSLLELVGLNARRDHKPDQLSGGEQQRIAIARALVNKPDIILADEPTGNLDSRSSREILSLLRRACDLKNQTTVMVTHDPNAASYADRVVFLRDGQIVRELDNSQGELNPLSIIDVITEIDQDSTK